MQSLNKNGVIHSVDDDNYRIIADNGPTSETNETLN